MLKVIQLVQAIKMHGKLLLIGIFKRQTFKLPMVRLPPKALTMPRQLKLAQAPIPVIAQELGDQVPKVPTSETPRLWLLQAMTLVS